MEESKQDSPLQEQSRKKGLSPIFKSFKKHGTTNIKF